MASRSMSPRGQFDLTDFLARRFSEAVGICLLLFSLVLAVSLWGYDASDPSLNHATSGPSSNPLGGFGATLADLCLQTVGTAIWFAVLVLPIWGVRLLLDRVPSWIWLSVAALPPAVLALAAYFATFDVPPIEAWPYLVGLGGVVGDFALHRLEPGLSGRYGLYALAASLVLAVVAIGITPREVIDGVRNMLGLTTRFERANNAPLRAPKQAARGRQETDDGPGLFSRVFGGVAVGVGGLFGSLFAKRDRGLVDRSTITKNVRRSSRAVADVDDDEDDDERTPPIPVQTSRSLRQQAPAEKPAAKGPSEVVQPVENFELPPLKFLASRESAIVSRSTRPRLRKPRKPWSGCSTISA